MKFTMNMLLTCIIFCDARPSHLIKTVCKYSMHRLLSQISYFSLFVFLQRRHSFTSRKLYVCQETLKFKFKFVSSTGQTCPEGRSTNRTQVLCEVLHPTLPRPERPER